MEVISKFVASSELSNLKQEGPSNISRGLVGMGQSIITEDKNAKLGTFGAGPCIAFGLKYTNGSNEKTMLCHFNPESNVDEFFESVKDEFPDLKGATFDVIMTTVRGRGDNEISSQEKMIDSIYQNIMGMSVMFTDEKEEILSDKSGLIFRNGNFEAVDDDSVMDYLGGGFSASDCMYQEKHMFNDASKMKVFV